MVDFGDEFIIESYKIPWLIWVQLVISILLLLLLLFGFAAFTYEASASSTAAAAAPSSPSACLNISTSPNEIVTVEDEMGAGDSGIGGGSSREEDDGSSLKDTMFMSIFRHPNNPCNYFGLAKQALFKCFGLDSSVESSRTQHEKRD